MVRAHFRQRRRWPRLYAGDPRFVRLHSTRRPMEWLRASRRPALTDRLRGARYWGMAEAPTGHRDAAVQRHRGLDATAPADRRRLRQSCSPSTGACSARRSSVTTASTSTARATPSSSRSPPPDDAAAAAVDGQRALARHPWPGDTEIRVRMGLHSGEPRLIERRYVGLDVHQAARVMAAGHGGQVLVSGVDARAARRPLPGA